MKRNLLLGLAIGVGSLANAQCDITGPDPIMCLTSVPVAMTVASPGAVFSGPGVTANIFDPAAAGLGTHTISVEAPGEGYSHGTIPFSPTAIPGGTVVGGLSDDNVVGTFPIGFTFNFFGTDYTNFYVGSNGFVTFSGGMPSGCCSGQVLPNASTPNNLIALSWNDLYPPAGGSVKYQTTGVAPSRVLIVDFTSIGHCCSMVDPVTSQIKIFEGTNCIEVNVTQQPRPSGNHTIGIENASGSEGYAPAGKNGVPGATYSYGYSFCPNVGCSNTIEVEVVESPSVNAFTSETEICLGESIDLTSSGTADLYSWGVSIDEGVAYTPTVSGMNNFIVVGTDAESGCVGTDMVSVMVHDIPYVDAGMDQMVCADNEFTLNAIGDDATYAWDNGAVDGVPMMQPVGTVTYTVTATNAGGCEATNTVDVESLEVPSGTGVVTMMTGLGYDGEIDFTPTGGTGGPYTFLWSNGATTEDINSLTVGSYTVTVSDGMCDSDVTFIVDSQAGIEFEQLENLTVYPNPVVDVFTIEFKGTYTWFIYDNTGKIVLNGQATGKELVSMEQLATGNYLLKVAVDGKESVVSLVKN